MPTQTKPNKKIVRITPALLKKWALPDPNDYESKEDRGRVLIVGGSDQIAGAVLLAGVAALRAGAGKLQIATAANAALPLAIALPEAKVVGLPADRTGAMQNLNTSAGNDAAHANAVLIGPGMDASIATRRIVENVVGKLRGAVVIDAGALHLSACRAFKRCDQAQAMVMTPHAGEMATLLDVHIDEITAQPDAIARDFAREQGVVLVLKGSTTYIASPDGHVWMNTAGSTGLGTSGSGDVLAGIITGLAARGAAAEQAAVWGVYLHAQAGALLSQRYGTIGFLAREISPEIPQLMSRM